MVNLWKDLPPGPNAPFRVNAIIEIPKGSRNKYEFQKDTGVMKLNRVLYSSLYYPGDYGLIPGTFFDDNDPLDILVMINEPTFSGCVIEVRPVGMYQLIDGKCSDDKILAVPVHDPIFDQYHELKDVPSHYLKEVEHFFQVYKDLEGKRTEGLGWRSKDEAYERIRYAMGLYIRMFGKEVKEKGKAKTPA